VLLIGPVEKNDLSHNAIIDSYMMHRSD